MGGERSGKLRPISSEFRRVGDEHFRTNRRKRNKIDLGENGYEVGGELEWRNI